MSTKVELKPYSDDLYQDVLNILTLSHHLDSIFPKVLKEKLNDVDSDHSLKTCAFIKDQLVGFTMGVIRNLPTQTIGYIKLLGVHPRHQNSGIGKLLLNEVELFAKKNQAKSIRLYDVPKNYFMPGIDPFYTKSICFAERNGFKKFGDTSNLIVDLEQDWYTQNLESSIKNMGVDICRAESYHESTLLNWINTDFPLWKAEIESALSDQPKSVHLAFEGTDIIGFSAFNGNNKGTGWFGPMGTTEKARGKGIGQILLKRCLADMNAAGLKESIIPWVGPIPFYSNYSNARVQRVFWRYEKTF